MPLHELSAVKSWNYELFLFEYYFCYLELSIIFSSIFYYLLSGMSSRNTNFSMKIFSNNILDESPSLTRSPLSLEAVCCRHCYSSCLPDLMSSAFYLLSLFLDSFRDRRNIHAAQHSRASSSRLTTVRCMSLKSRTEKLWNDIIVWYYCITFKLIFYQWKHLLRLYNVKKKFMLILELF